jgi:hypothetical protein
VEEIPSREREKQLEGGVEGARGFNFIHYFKSIHCSTTETA